MTADTMSFNERYGPWAIVTGASDGIGCAFARNLAARGINLVLVARRHQNLAALETELTGRFPIACHVVAADLSSMEGVEKVLGAAADLDVGLLVCSAGFGSAGDFLENDLASELNMLQVNCAAVTALTWHFGRRFKQRHRGGLILLSSLVAFQGVPRSAHYAATKSYIQSLAEALRIEWSRHGVAVLSVAPGPVGTGFARRADMSMGKVETPEVVAHQSLRALGKVGTLRPGLLAKLLGYHLALSPRWLRVRIMGRVMLGMTRHLTR